MAWKVRAIRGATTATHNSKDAIYRAVKELIDEIERRNQLDPAEIVSAIFTATPDLNVIFPATVARDRPQWENVPLLDLQQMQVEGSLKRCIRVLIQINTPLPQDEIIHVYLGEAKNLRPDWNLAQIAQSR
ncbi:chorismate mutase [Spirulina sp. CS-785/01]|uniref:chorismate mutase n=1 Tax=Spirulina sp. CS-785/01 TaxID=3021716 RepID=UPI00232D4980|nr:chorismate mutase [Spirulina sp. CS-785/01]MDB9316050.1 chorismate mutase [Spirulina sp. CS-785/01]